MKKILLVTHYHAPTMERRTEYENSIRRNASIFDEVRVLVEDDDCYKPPARNTYYHTVDQRQTFDRLFDFANNINDGVVFLSNTDIVFNETVRYVDEIKWDDAFAVLAKYEQAESYCRPRLVNRYGSFDSFIFKPPLRNLHCPFYLGLPHCDKRVALMAMAAGYYVFNPCKFIVAIHNHHSKVRSYTDERVEGQVARVSPDVLIPWADGKIRTRPRRGQ